MIALLESRKVVRSATAKSCPEKEGIVNRRQRIHGKRTKKGACTGRKLASKG